jgi:hypothetical protein
VRVIGRIRYLTSERCIVSGVAIEFKQGRLIILRFELKIIKAKLRSNEMKKSDVKVEFVVCAKHELKDNLERTVLSALDAMANIDGSVRVVLDGWHEFEELPFLAAIQKELWFPKNLHDSFIYTENKKVLYEIPWLESRGVGPCRNWAAETSWPADVLVFVDGHMEFPEGLGMRIAEHLGKFPDDVTCCKMRSVNWDWNGDNVYGGCSLASFVEEGRNRRGVAAKWYKDGGNRRAGKIACAMGACYGIRRERYVAIGKPWRILKGWGCAEQTLCVANRLCGGRIWLLDDVVSHVYAAPHFRGAATLDEGVQSMVNHFAFVAAFCPDGLQDELFNWMLGGKSGYEIDVITKELEKRRSSVVEVRKACDAGKRWHKLIIRKWTGEASTVARNKGVVTQRNKGIFQKTEDIGGKEKKHSKCSMCNAVDSFEAGGKNGEEGGKNAARTGDCLRIMSCKRCGHRIQARKLEYITV